MRPSGRDPATMREVRFVTDFTKHAEGSVLASFGDTQSALHRQHRGARSWLDAR